MAVAQQSRYDSYNTIVTLVYYITPLYLQVFVNLHPLNVCMSYQRTLDLVQGISQDHDIEVQFWADELKKLIERPNPVETPTQVSLYNIRNVHGSFSCRWLLRDLSVLLYPLH